MSIKHERKISHKSSFLTPKNIMYTENGDKLAGFPGEKAPFCHRLKYSRIKIVFV